MTNRLVVMLQQIWAVLPQLLRRHNCLAWIVNSLLHCRVSCGVTQRNLTRELSRACYFDAVKPLCYLSAFMYESEELLTAPRAVCSEQHKCNGLNIKAIQNPLKTTERLQLNPEDFESRPTRVKSAVLMGFLRGSYGKLEKGFQFLEPGDYWGLKLLLFQIHWFSFSFFPVPAQATLAQEQRTSCTHLPSLPLFPQERCFRKQFEVKMINVVTACPERSSTKAALRHELTEDCNI